MGIHRLKKSSTSSAHVSSLKGLRDLLPAVVAEQRAGEYLGAAVGTFCLNLFYFGAAEHAELGLGREVLAAFGTGILPDNLVPALGAVTGCRIYLGLAFRAHGTRWI